MDHTSTIKTIYRVEDAEGRGPFYSGLVNVYADAAEFAHLCALEGSWPDSYYAARNAMADADAPTMFAAATYAFGCLTLADLRYWFPSAYGITAMADAGAVVGVYEAQLGSVRHGTRQAAFDRTESRRLRQMPITALLDLTAPESSLRPHLPREDTTAPECRSAAQAQGSPCS